MKFLIYVSFLQFLRCAGASYSCTVGCDIMSDLNMIFDDKKIESVMVGRKIAFKRDTMMVGATMSFLLRSSISKGLE